MLAWHYEKKFPNGVAENIRRDYKEKLFFPFLAQSDIAFSKFKEIWRSAQFSVIHQYCPEQSDSGHFLQLLFSIVLSYVNDAGLNYRDYKGEKGIFADDDFDLDLEAIIDREEKGEESPKIPQPPITRVENHYIRAAILNVAVIYALYCTFQTQHVAPNKGRRPIRISVEKWMEILLVNKGINILGRLGTQARRMIYIMISNSSFQIAAYPGPISLMNCISAARTGEGSELIELAVMYKNIEEALKSENHVSGFINSDQDEIDKEANLTASMMSGAREANDDNVGDAEALIAEVESAFKSRRR